MRAMRRPTPAEAPPIPTEQPGALAYVIGNGSALMAGFIACYVALLHSGITMKGWDFFYYYSVSRMVVEGHGGLIYNLHALGHMEAALAQPYRVPHGVLPNLSPPYFAVALAPLALLPYNVAYLGWLILDCLLLAAAMYYLERYAELAGRSALWFRLAAFCSLPALVAILQGQSSIINLTFLVATLWALSAGRDRLAGAMLALALIKPQYALPFLAVLLVQRRAQALVWCALGSAFLLLAPIPVLGASTDGAYVRTLLEATSWSNEVGGFGPIWNRGFPGFTRLLLPHPMDAVVAAAFAACAVALLLQASRRCTHVQIAFALAGVVSLLVSPHVLIHDLTLLLLPAAVALHFRPIGPSRLPAILLGVYLAINAGFGLVFLVPVQLSALAMIGLATWLYLAARGNENISGGPVRAQVPVRHPRPDAAV